MLYCPNPNRIVRVLLADGWRGVMDGTLLVGETGISFHPNDSGRYRRLYVHRDNILAVEVMEDDPAVTDLVAEAKQARGRHPAGR